MFAIATMPYELAMSDELSMRQFYANTQRLVAALEAAKEALEALKAENERLRKVLDDADNELDWLDGDIDKCDHSVGVCMCDYWNMRREMKAALSKEDSND